MSHCPHIRCEGNPGIVSHFTRVTAGVMPLGGINITRGGSLLGGEEFREFAVKHEPRNEPVSGLRRQIARRARDIGEELIVVGKRGRWVHVGDAAACAHVVESVRKLQDRVGAFTVL